jgi:AFG3 family protein
MATEEQKKKLIQKRLNPGNNNGSEEDPKKRPRVSIYWIYGLIFAAIIGYNLYKNTNGGSGVEIENTQFFAMLKQGDVDQIKTVGNKKIVRVFINPQALQNNAAFYRNVFGNDYEAVRKMTPPQAYFGIIKDETFAAEMLQFYKDNPELKHVADKPGDEGELFGQIVTTLLPILLIGLLFIMMMRKVGAGCGGGGPGGIFNIGISKATLFDKGALVIINFGDVAGLDEA